MHPQPSPSNSGLEMLDCCGHNDLVFMPKKIISILLAAVIVVLLYPAIDTTADGPDYSFTFIAPADSSAELVDLITESPIAYDESIPTDMLAFFAVIFNYDNENYAFVGWRINGIEYYQDTYLGETDYITEEGLPYDPNIAALDFLTLFPESELPYPGLLLIGTLKKDMVVEAVFTEISEATYSASVTTNGEKKGSADCSHLTGDTYSLVAAPNVGYVFEKWEYRNSENDDGWITYNELITANGAATIDEDTQFRAVFRPARLTLYTGEADKAYLWDYVVPTWWDAGTTPTWYMNHEWNSGITAHPINEYDSEMLISDSIYSRASVGSWADLRIPLAITEGSMVGSEINYAVYFSESSLAASAHFGKSTIMSYAPNGLVISLSFTIPKLPDISTIRLKAWGIDSDGEEWELNKTYSVSPIQNQSAIQPGTPTISVSFRLIGSTLAHSDIELKGDDDMAGFNGADYVTWIPTSNYTLMEGATVRDLFELAITQAKLEARDSQSNYIRYINAPSVLGGYRLAEFTNGKFSGWMFTIGKNSDGSDGVHSRNGLKEQRLSAGDVVIWHYVNDYRYEVQDWFGDDPSALPSEGKGALWNRWLKATDIAPNSGNNSVGTVGGNIETSVYSTEVKVTANSGSNGTASASLDSSSISDALNTALRNAPTGTIPEVKVLVDMPVGTIALNTTLKTVAIKGIANNTNAQLTISSNLGDITFNNIALSGLVNGIQDSFDITFGITQVDKTALTDAQREVVEDNPVFDLTVKVGSNAIRSFDASVTVFLPYTIPAGVSTTDLTVYYVSENGNIEQMSNVRYDANRRGFTFTTSHFSLFMISPFSLLLSTPLSDAPDASFSDVKTTDWYYDAVKYIVGNGLMNGVGNGRFAPDSPMTRAMLVTVLYRYAGKPVVSGTSDFNDVKYDTWYTDAIVWATQSGIVKGYSSTSFGTNDNVTREQIATILFGFAEFMQLDTAAATNLSGYVDTDSISTWAEAAMKWANAKGLMVGRTANSLAPKSTATRAEVATLLMRFVEYFEM